MARLRPSKGGTIPPTHPNVGVQARYQRRLEALVDEMHRSVAYWVLAAYRPHAGAAPVAAQDADPASLMKRIMTQLTKRWTRKFADLSNEMAQGFLAGVVRHTDTSFMDKLKRAGWTVQFKPTAAVRNAVTAATTENVGLIRSIASQHLQGVEGAVMRSVMRGRDLGGLARELEEGYGVTKRRAAFIARDQNNKATAVINQARQLELGITQAIWRHSGAGKHPRPGHVKAGRDRLVYDIAKGALIDGEFIQPGELINCRCVSVPVIPGFED